MPPQQTKFPIDIEKMGRSATYQTSLGAAFLGDSLQLLEKLPDNSINLVFTSPPFALQREKEYGNKGQNEYVEWLAEFAEIEGRCWLAFEKELQYLATSSFRFMDEDISEHNMNIAYQKIMANDSIEIIADSRQLTLLEKDRVYQV